jgi:hypothetical protein
MTALITKIIEAAVHTQSYTHLPTTETATVLLLLIAILLEREILRAIGSSRALAMVRVLNIFIVPLCLAFITIMAVRMLYFLNIL